MKTLGFYLSKRFLFAITAVFALCFVLVFMIDFIEQLRVASGKKDAPISVVLLLVLLRVPAFLEMILPFAVLIGSIGAFLTLSRSSELVIIRAAGISVWQFVKPGLFVAALVGVATTTLYNPLAAAAKDYADRLVLQAFAEKKATVETSGEGAWMRQDSVDGPSVLHARIAAGLRSQDRDRSVVSLGGVTVLQFDRNNKFVERIEAKTATLRHGYWELETVSVSAPGMETGHYNKYFSSTNLDPTHVTQTITAPESVSFWELPRFIELVEKSGLPALQYKLQYETLIARPLLMITMVLVAATCSLRPFRFGKIQTMVITGLTAGFVFYIFGELSRQLGVTGFVSTSVAVWAPGGMASFLALTVLLHQEDG
jgi:lipopolysaccharide export system permease protein